MRNYKLTDETTTVQIDGSSYTTLHRIECTKDFNTNGRTIKKGEKGGFIEHEYNLDGNAWVFDNAKVYGDARVYELATISDNATICDNARVCGYAKVYGRACVFDDALVCDNAQVYGDAHIFENASVRGSAEISKNARIFEQACIDENVSVLGNAMVGGNVEIRGNTKIMDNTNVGGYCTINGNTTISGNTRIEIPSNGETVVLTNAKILGNGCFMAITNVGKDNEVFVAYLDNNNVIMLSTPTYNGKLDDYPLSKSIGNFTELECIYTLLNRKFFN